MKTLNFAVGEILAKMTKKRANEITGGLSDTAKMACKSFGIPAAECITGAILRDVAGSTCSDCYALKGNYTRYPAVIAAQYRRFELLTRALNDMEFRALWIKAMITLIGIDSKFRWHDSGDVQSIAHLELICDIARALPDCAFWLPTREKSIVNKHARLFAVPENLCIRVSAAMIDGDAPTAANTSTVHTNLFSLVGMPCKAPDQNGECRECRACWDKNVPNVSYKKH